MKERGGEETWFWLEHVSARVAASRGRVGNLINEAQLLDSVRRAEGRKWYRFSNFRPVKRWRVPTARPPREGAISAVSSLMFSDVVVSPRMKDELSSLIGDQVQFLEVALKRPVAAKWARAADEVAKSVFVVVPLVQLECIDWRKTNWKRVAISAGTYLINSEYVDIPEQTVLNLSRVPANVQCFSPHGAAGELVISKAVARVIRRARVASFNCVRAKCVGKSRGKMRLSDVNMKVVGASMMPREEVRHAWLDGIEVDKYGKSWNAADVRLLEQAIGVKIPKQVRDFVRAAGSCIINHQEVFGQNGVSATASSRALVKLVRGVREQCQRLPRDVVPICDDGRGGYFALDIRKERNGDCPVVAIDHELNDALKGQLVLPQIAASFAVWVRSLSH